jgi:hypothetical protein
MRKTLSDCKSAISIGTTTMGLSVKSRIVSAVMSDITAAGIFENTLLLRFSSRRSERLLEGMSRSVLLRRLSDVMLSR